MCFSASISFIAATFLAITAKISFNAARNDAQRMLAAIPLFFSLQQGAEGIVWITAHNPTSLIHITAMYTFLLFAFVVWPLWIPAAIGAQEKNTLQKNIILVLFLIGAATSIYLSFYLVTNPISAEIINCHIVYVTPIPQPMYILIAYSLAIIAPFFVSSLKTMWTLGFLLALSCILSLLMWHLAFTSVWCFFAALLSVYVIRIIKGRIW